MALVLPVNGVLPTWGEQCWLAPNATVVGNVVMGNSCTVWFNAVVRGDVNNITIGNKVNIQDGAVIHCTYQRAATSIGDNVSIGHNAIVHGCQIEENVLIGMGAIVMDNCVVKKNSVIAAGAVVTANTVVEENSIYAGVPAKFIKKLSQEQVEQLILKTANNYTLYAQWFE